MTFHGGVQIAVATTRPSASARDERAEIGSLSRRMRIADDAERQLMLRLARLEERPTDIEERLDRVEAARLDRHRVSRA